ncbi:MAG: amidohydrolase family protein [Victivallaceae bacterium]|nr:amidohydrolase family protein [Victivallaceae bacterium]MDD4180683.1 amidohydrolase family protein [Victivallaceae bacterium]
MFIDIHAHAYKRPFLQLDGRKPFPTPEQLIAHYDRIGVEKAVIMPLIGPEFYLSQSNEDILESAERFPERFIPFINIHPRAINNSPHAPLSEVILKYKEIGAKGIGEVICNMPIRDPFVLNFFRHVEISGLPMTIHIGHRLDHTYGIYDEPGLPMLCEALGMFPDLKIFAHSQAFWAEIGELDMVTDRAGYPKGKIVREGVVPKMLRRYPNLYGDLSAGSGCNALTRDPEYAVRFLDEFQDKLMFGLDICSPPDGNIPGLAKFMLELRASGQITEIVFQKIAKENAIRLLKL